MWAEIINGAVAQTMQDNDPVNTSDGMKYPGNWPKSSIPNLEQVTLATTPDARLYTIAGESVEIVNGVPTQVYATNPLTLAQVQQNQITTLQSACQAAIEAGFASSALGASANYPSDPRSQVNIALAAANGGSLWCETGTTWDFTAHTAAQAQQVQKDLTAHIQSCQSKYAGLLAQVNAATAATAVLAVAWS